MITPITPGKLENYLRRKLKPYITSRQGNMYTISIPGILEGTLIIHYGTITSLPELFFEARTKNRDVAETVAQGLPGSKTENYASGTITVTYRYILKSGYSFSPYDYEEDREQIAKIKQLLDQVAQQRS